MKKLIVPAVMTVIIIISILGIIVGYNSVKNYCDSKNAEIDRWSKDCLKYQSEAMNLGYELEDLDKSTDWLYEEIVRVQKENEYLEKDIGVWIDKSVQLQYEIKEWEACAKKRNEKVKILPVVSKTLILTEVIPKVLPGVVHISCPQWQGSGFIISEHLIATARHVVEGVEDFTITLDNGDRLHATRAISSEDHDIAFIWVKESMTNALELGSIRECKLGQSVFAVGSPFGKVNYNSVTLGIISGLNRDYDELNDGVYGSIDYGWDVAFQTDAPGHPGNSGGPIFTLDGKVRGILVGGFSPSLIIAMPVDLFLKDIEMIELMFLQDEYYHEEKEEEYTYSYTEVQVGPYPGDVR